MTKYVLQLDYRNDDSRVKTFESDQTEKEIHAYLSSIFSSKLIQQPIKNTILDFGDYQTESYDAYDYELYTLDEWFQLNKMKLTVDN